MALINDTGIDEFNVTGYVVAVIECLRNSQCVVADGIVRSPLPVTDSLPERPEDLVTLGHDRPTRLELELSQKYTFFVKRGHEVV